MSRCVLDTAQMSGRDLNGFKYEVFFPEMETHAKNTFKVAEVLQDTWDHLLAKLDLNEILQFLLFTGEGAEDPV